MSSSPEQQNVDVRTPLPGVTLQELGGMNDEEFWAYARQRARIHPEAPLHAEYVECKLTGCACLVALHDLAEVLPPPHRLARLPGMPAWMVGIMAWRGETIAVVNLDLYLCTTRPYDASWLSDGMLLIANRAELTVGLLVPTLGFTSTLALEQIVPLHAASGFTSTLDPTLIAGVYTDIPILDIPALLNRLTQHVRQRS